MFFQPAIAVSMYVRSEEHTSELQSQFHLVCRLPPTSTLFPYTTLFRSIILNAPAYVNDYGMVITNNSYGDNIECGYYGTYDLYARMMDQMAFDLPQLENVFSAGNSGLDVCEIGRAHV